jgi:hypothetical protein
MTPLRSGLLVVALLTPCFPWRAEAAEFRVNVDTSKTPNAQPYVEPVKALCEEWYPKINVILFGKDRPLPFTEIHIRFEPKVEKCDGPKCIEAGGFADENTIQINFGYLSRTKDDYRAMVIHELAHVNQHYKESPGTGWLVEGIADYVRHRHFEKDLQPKLLELDGYRFGGSPVEEQAKLRKEGYLFGYTIAAPFLYWLELRKAKDLLISLSLALREGSYSPDLFQKHCGAPLDALWREFIRESGSPD